MTDSLLDRVGRPADAAHLREALREEDRLRRAEAVLAQALDRALGQGPGAEAPDEAGAVAGHGPGLKGADPTPDDERAAGRREGMGGGVDLLDGGTDRPGL